MRLQESWSVSVAIQYNVNTYCLYGDVLPLEKQWMIPLKEADYIYTGYNLKSGVTNLGFCLFSWLTSCEEREV